MASTASIILKYLVLGSERADASLERSERRTRELGAASQDTARRQENLGKASASAGRQFSAQASGLGGLVAAYAGAAANIFALQQAFAALNRVAQIENIIRGTNTLAATVGASGEQIISTLQSITRSQITAAEAAEAANLAFASGFSGEQLTQITDVATRASLALGRNLTDSLQRLTRGAAKLEPELLDELGIFTRIEPAVQKYADSIGKSASQLTRFERQQAFINEVIDEGSRKFADIDITSSNAQTSLERLSTKLLELGTTIGQILLDFLIPFVDFFADNITNAFVLFGAISTLVLGKFTEVAGAAFSRAGVAATAWAENLTLRVSQSNKAFNQAERNLTRAAGVIDRSLRNLAGPRDLAKGVRDFVKELKNGNVPLETLRQRQAEINRLLDETRRKLQSNRQERERINEAIARGVATERQRTRLGAIDRSDTAQGRNVRALELLDRTVNRRLQTVSRSANAFSRLVSAGVRAVSVIGGVGGAILTVVARLSIFIFVVQLLNNVIEKVFGVDLLGNFLAKLGEGILFLREEINDTTESIETFGFQAASVGREAIQDLGVSSDVAREAIEQLNTTIKDVIDTADDAVNSSINNLFGLFASDNSFKFETLEELEGRIESIRQAIVEAVGDQEFERLPGLRAVQVGLEAVRDQLEGFDESDFDLVRALNDIARAAGTTGSATTELAQRYLSVSDNGEKLIATFQGVSREVGDIRDNGQAENLNEDVVRLIASFEALTSGLREGDLAASQVVERITTLTSLADQLERANSNTLTVAAQAELQALDTEIENVKQSIASVESTLANLEATRARGQGDLVNPRFEAEKLEELRRLQEELQFLIEDRPAIQEQINEQLEREIALNQQQAESVKEIFGNAQGFVDAFSSSDAIISSLTSKLGTFNDTLSKGLGVFFEDINTIDLTNFTNQAAVGLNIQQSLATLEQSRLDLLADADRLAAEGVDISEDRLKIEKKIVNFQIIQIALAFELVQAAIDRRRELQEILRTQRENVALNNLQLEKQILEDNLSIAQDSLKVASQATKETVNRLNFAVRLKEVEQERANEELKSLNNSIEFANELLSLEQERADLALETTERQIEAEFRLRELRLQSRGQFLDSFENFGTRGDRRQNQLDLINLEEEKQKRLLEARIAFEEERLGREIDILNNERLIIENEIQAKESQLQREQEINNIRNGIIATQITAAENERVAQAEIIRQRIAIVEAERDINTQRIRNDADREIRGLELEKLKAENDVKFIDELTTTNQNFLDELANILSQAVPGRTIEAGQLESATSSVNDIPALIEQQIQGVIQLRDQEINLASRAAASRVDALIRERSLIQRQIQERIRELQREATLNTAQSALRQEQLANEISVLEGQLVTNQEQQDLARASSEERIAGLKDEFSQVSENAALRRDALEQEADVLRQLADDISGVLRDKIGQGIQDLSKAYFDSTLTAENFKQGVRDLFVGILDGIRERVTERLIVQPVENLIGSAFDGLFGEANNDGSTPERALYTRDANAGGGIVNQAEEAANAADKAFTDTIESTKDKTTGFFGSIFGEDGILVQGLQGVGRIGRDVFAGLGTGLQSIFNGLTGGSGSGISSFFGTIAGGIGSLFGAGGANAAVSSASSAAGFFGTSTSALSSGLFIASGGLVKQLNSGGFVSQFSAGGPNMLRDRVPALLEPGEFVMNKRATQDIGLNNLRAMNGTGGMNGGNVSVNIQNNGTSQETEGQPQVRFDGEKYIIDIILKDLRNNGPIRKGIRGNT